MFALQVFQACDDPGDVGASAGLGKLRLKNAATPLTKAVVSSGGDGTAMGIEHMVLILGVRAGYKRCPKVPLYKFLFSCLLFLSLLPCCGNCFLFVKVLSKSVSLVAFWDSNADIPVLSLSISADLLLCGHHDSPSDVVSLQPHSAVKASHCLSFTSTTSTTFQRLDYCILGYSA
jgi:hypothetical protein